ncbi:hypothetical protein ADEAN_000358900 [Angomonas deanei]|uniref:Uncharacterized protein n=1 Tax=Angomonas deanei TaxID=59799 RepID=A0A7G2C8R6_9TRYP|nr:hypothetical protein ADEAN_000358900 [Angomonas deanei]
MRRTRLVNTGAALQRGLKPVTPTPKRTFAYGSPSLWRRDNDSTATGGRRSANHSGATSRAGSARRSSDAFTPTTVDGNEEVALALEELAVLIQSGTNAPSTQFGGYAMNQHGNLRAAQRRKNSRLKAAEKLILNEYELQKKLNEELFHEADSRDRFVLVLPTPQLFNLKFGEEDDNHNGDDREWPVLKDSLPLNKSEWDGLFDKQYFMLNAKRKSRMSLNSQMIEGNTNRALEYEVTKKPAAKAAGGKKKGATEKGKKMTKKKISLHPLSSDSSFFIFLLVLVIIIVVIVDYHFLLSVLPPQRSRRSDRPRRSRTTSTPTLPRSLARRARAAVAPPPPSPPSRLVRRLRTRRRKPPPRTAAVAAVVALPRKVPPLRRRSVRPMRTAPSTPLPLRR